MARTEPGLLRTSFRFVNTALNENVLLRTSVLVTVLCITLACIALAFFGVTYTLGPEQTAKVYSPRLFGLLFLPAEFLIYDLILGNREPRATIKDLYLDWRLLRLFWAQIKMSLVLLLPILVFVLLVVAATAGFGKGSKPSGAALLVMIAAFLAAFCALFYCVTRFFYLPIVVARREEKPVRTAWRETKGRLWAIGCALFLPYVTILAVAIPMELLGPVLERRLGFVGLAPWFLLDAGLTGFLSCLGAAVLALSYQRIIGTAPAAEASGPEFSLSPPEGPQAGGTDSGG